MEKFYNFLNTHKQKIYIILILIFLYLIFNNGFKIVPTKNGKDQIYNTYSFPDDYLIYTYDATNFKTSKVTLQPSNKVKVTKGTQLIILKKESTNEFKYNIIGHIVEVQHGYKIVKPYAFLKKVNPNIIRWERTAFDPNRINYVSADRVIRYARFETENFSGTFRNLVALGESAKLDVMKNVPNDVIALKLHDSVRRALNTNSFVTNNITKVTIRNTIDSDICDKDINCVNISTINEKYNGNWYYEKQRELDNDIRPILKQIYEDEPDLIRRYDEYMTKENNKYYDKIRESYKKPSFFQKIFGT